MPVRSLALIALAAVAGWRLVAAGATEVQRIAATGIEQRVRVLCASNEQRLRWTLGANHALHAALRAHVAAVGRVALYGAAIAPGTATATPMDGARDPRGAMTDRLTLLENQLRELLFPVRITSLVGPLRRGVPPPPGDGHALLVVNVTPAQPLPGPLDLVRLQDGPGFTIWRMDPRRAESR